MFEAFGVVNDSDEADADEADARPAGKVSASDDDDEADEADEGASMSEREEDALELPVVRAEREWDVPVALLWSRCSR